MASAPSASSPAQKHAVVYGGSGGLGVQVVNAFKARNWSVTAVDFRENPAADRNIVLDFSLVFEEKGKTVDKELRAFTEGAKVDAIINVAGGWAGGNLLDDDLYKNVTLMISQSINSSVITAKLSATHLKEDGFLLLVGADAAKAGTPGMMAYGLAKAAVHQLVASIAAPGSGFPAQGTVMGILPVTLDTPMNRKFMPDADFSSWTPLNELSYKIVGWAEGAERVESGSLIRLVTEGGNTNYVKL
ncbi:hypothetical protein BC830DRAFT_1070224 [Chytriomyces sp. MP71]|nr:hypothetical protein BC830DRAFT_1070224 [Chytriomyces sp. MP71]